MQDDCESSLAGSHSILLRRELAVELSQSSHSLCANLNVTFCGISAIRQSSHSTATDLVTNTLPFSVVRELRFKLF
jgi:hypothetical protein